MWYPFRRAINSLIAVLALLGVGRASAADWPTYRHDPQRSGRTAETLALPLHLAWEYHCAQPPAPAWPDPEKVLNRLDFDYAPQLVVAGGLVFFGSSADDTVRALDLATGAERWHYTTGGPVRFAPQVAEGRVYFASDDGYATCLEAASGALVWRVRLAPNDELLVGNDRLISRWPCRTGVLLADGAVYVSAGMWPAEGTFVYALEPESGKIRWVNDTCGYINDARTLHLGEDFATYGVAPQGPLVRGGEVLLVPTGKGLPAAFDYRTGELRYYHMEAGVNQVGGTWITVDGKHFHTTPLMRSFSLATGDRTRTIGPKVPSVSAQAPGKAFMVWERMKISALVLDGQVTFRRAFELARAGEHLIEGGDNEVVVLTAGAEPQAVWRAPVQGEARGLAVADGRLLVSTRDGLIYAFAATPVAQPSRHGPRQSLRTPMPPAPLPADWGVPANERGYALVLGDTDGAWSRRLLAHTQYRVVQALTEPAVVASQRAAWLRDSTHYGSRVQTLAIAAGATLPLPDFFANLVLVAGAPAGGITGVELYRVLRPCGGRLVLPDLPPPTAHSQLGTCGALATELHAADAPAVLRRGQLPGALDWDSKEAVDRRVQWPLRLLWFGGPGPALVLDRKQGNNIGPVAYGRMLARSEDALTAVDAYNSTILWTRPLTQNIIELLLADRTHRSEQAASISGKDYGTRIALDADTVYISTVGYFPEKAPAGFLLDAATGIMRRAYGPWTPPPRVLLADSPQWTLKLDETGDGTLALSRDGGDLVFTMSTRFPAPGKFDRWDLFLDCRPHERRYGLYEPGTLQFKCYPATAERPGTLELGKGQRHPPARWTSEVTATGTLSALRVALAELAALAGEAPASLGFAARLQHHQPGNTAGIAQRYLFCDITAESLNNGWATLVLDPARVPEPLPPPAILAGPFEAMPKFPNNRRSLNAAPPDSAMRVPRQHPLTGELGPKFYQTGSFGCGGIAYAQSLAITRSTAVGIYDFTDDSGMRVFDGTKPSCSGSVMAGLGLLLSSEGRGGCECTTNFQTSLALAPATRRSHEDWALFYDLEGEAPVRQATLNLGAPGDRRHDDGRLWLGFPRIQNAKGRPELPPGAATLGLGRSYRPGVLQVPLTLTGSDGFAPRRVNADRVAVAGTSQPWLYSSWYQGLRSATLALGEQPYLRASALARPPTLDGQLATDEWPAQPAAELAASQSRLWLARDDGQLYIAASRPALLGRLGETIKWNPRAAPADSIIDRDEGFEVFISDAKQALVVHLAVLVNGARYDALVRGERTELRWTGPWQSAVVADDKTFTAELAVPLALLRELGLDLASLRLNVMQCGPWRTTDALRIVTARGHCDRFVPILLGDAPAAGPRRFTVRLHFAEMAERAPGERVFAVKLQDQVVLPALDIAREVGQRRALIKEFTGIAADRELRLEFLPAPGSEATDRGPILNALEILDEALHPPQP